MLLKSLVSARQSLLLSLSSHPQPSPYTIWDNNMVILTEPLTIYIHVDNFHGLLNFPCKSIFMIKILWTGYPLHIQLQAQCLIWCVVMWILCIVNGHKWRWACATSLNWLLVGIIYPKLLHVLPLGRPSPSNNLFYFLICMLYSVKRNYFR